MAKARRLAEYDLRCLDCTWSKRVTEDKCAEVMQRHERTHRRHRTWRMAVTDRAAKPNGEGRQTPPGTS